MTFESTVIPVVVSGEVQKPGKVAFERPATVLEAIMEAGGFTSYADPKEVSLIRQVQGDHHSQTVDLSPIFEGNTYACTVCQPRRPDLRSSKIHQF